MVGASARRLDSRFQSTIHSRSYLDLARFNGLYPIIFLVDIDLVNIETKMGEKEYIIVTSF